MTLPATLNALLPSRPLLSLDVVTEGRVVTIADPFPVSHEGQLYVLAEIVGYRPTGGFYKKIGVFRIADDLASIEYRGETWGADDGLYSYPYVLRDGDRFLLVPEVIVPFEGRETGLHVLQIYETAADAFPHGWRKIHEGILPRCQAPSDKVLLRADDRFWLFCSDNASKRLMLYHSTDLKHWSAHPASPLGPFAHRRPAADVWRLGGGPVSLEQALALPLQHKFSSGTYGGAVTLLRIDELTPERVQLSLAPEPILAEDAQRPWMAKGAHHVALADHLGRTILATDGNDGTYWTSHVMQLPVAWPLSPAPDRGRP
jgi:hypothetical protein